MYSLKYVIFLTMALFFRFVYGQENFSIVDSVSYQMYLQKQWKELCKYGSSAAQNGMDYYYLDVRIGVAYFERGNYQKAELYFRKALANNSASPFAQTYLFWTLYNSGAEPEAAKMFTSFSDSLQKEISYHPHKVLNSVYLESGIKFSSNQSTAANLYYENAALSHRFSPRFELSESYVYMNQKLVWGNMFQNQLILTPTVHLNKRWTISLTLNYSNYQSQLNYSDSFHWQNSTQQFIGGHPFKLDSSITKNYTFDGGYKQNALLSQINFNRRAGNWSITPHLAVYTQWENPNYKQVARGDYQITSYAATPPSINYRHDTLSSIVTQKSTFLTWQLGINLSYTVLNRLTLGMDVNYIHYSGFNKLNASPYLSFQISKHVGMSVYYVTKKNYLLALNGGSLFLNSYNAVKNKVSVSTYYILSRRLQLFVSYQHEKNTDNLSLRDYQLNSLYIGLKIKL